MSVRIGGGTNGITLCQGSGALSESRGLFKILYHSACRVMNLWLPTVGCWINEEFVCYTLKFAHFTSKQTNLSSIEDNLAQNPKFLTDNRQDSCKNRVLVCKQILRPWLKSGPGQVSLIQIAKISWYFQFGLRDYPSKQRRYSRGTVSVIRLYKVKVSSCLFLR